MGTEQEQNILFTAAEHDASFLDIEEKPSEQEEEGSSILRISLPNINWKTFFLLVGIAASFVFHWLTTSQIFNVPTDVAISREKFFEAKKSYFHNPSYWDAKQQQFATRLHEVMDQEGSLTVLREIKQIPGEVFISYMLKNLHINPERLERSAIFSKEDRNRCLLILSKPEKSIWPFSIMLALELELKISADRFSLSVSRLRRGTQDIALGLAWTYFGPELESIRQVASTSKQSFILLSTNDTPRT